MTYLSQTHPNVADPWSLADEVVLPRLFHLAGSVKGLRICDLACGSGRVGRALVRRGATVVGVDFSLSLLEIARARERAEPVGITYFQDDATTLESLTRRSFDGVLCHMTLMDIEDLKAAFFSVSEILKPGGWFLFSVGHPCFQAPNASWVRREDGTLARQVSDYFAEGVWLDGHYAPAGERSGAPRHRTLTTYLNTLLQTGFALERIQEPQATVAAAARIPGYTSIPAFIIMKARKQPAI